MWKDVILPDHNHATPHLPSHRLWKSSNSIWILFFKIEYVEVLTEILRNASILKLSFDRTKWPSWNFSCEIFQPVEGVHWGNRLLVHSRTDKSEHKTPEHKQRFCFRCSFVFYDEGCKMMKGAKKRGKVLKIQHTALIVMTNLYPL